MTGADGGKAAHYLADRAINKRLAEQFQLGVTDTGRLTIPYLTPTGLWHLKYRCLSSHDCKAFGHAKYAYDDGAQMHLFNAQTLKTATDVVVTEGELDAISVEGCGFSAVAYPGAQAWQANQHWVYAFDSAETVTVVADGDKPLEGQTVGVGEQAGKKVADSLRRHLPHVDVSLTVMPVGHDSNSFIKTEGDIAFLEYIGVL